MWVMWIYIVCVETWCIRYEKLPKQDILWVSREKALFARHSRNPTVTICHDSLHSNHVLSTCFTSQESFSRATCENFFALHFALSLHTLSHTQPLQRNPRQNTGYIRFNIITIKFGTELKLIQNSCKSQLYKNSELKCKEFCVSSKKS